MKTIKNILFLLGIILINSCTPTIDADYQLANRSVTIGGLVVDINNNPISNAQVTIGNKTIKTDANGIFYIENVNMASNKYFVKFEAPNYLPNYRSGKLTKSTLKFKVTLLSYDDITVETINTQTGGTITVNGGGEITFPAGLKYVVERTGELYTGNLRVIAYYVDPTQPGYTNLVPGGHLWGVKNARLKKLNPFGGMFVILRDPSGRKINLSPNNTDAATIKIPIPLALQGNAPDTINFWTDDFNKSFCMSAGSGSRDQDKYVADVLHFSYWRAAIDYDQTTEYTGTVKDCNGNPVQGIKVKINNVYFGFTDADGKYKITAPRGLFEPAVSIDPQDYAGLGYYETLYGQQNGATVIRNISLPCTQTLEGIISGCHHIPATAFIRASYTNQQTGMEESVSMFAQNGNFRLYLPDYINSAEVTISTRDTTISEYVDLSGGTNVNYHEFNVCNSQPGTASLTISGFDYPDTTLNEFLGFYAYPSESIMTLYMEGNEIGLSLYFNMAYNYFNFDTNYNNIALTNAAYGEIYVQDATYPITSGSLTITSLDTINENRVEGYLSGYITNDTLNASISGHFDIPISQQ